MSIVFNRKALFNYEILEKFEAGIVLMGNEVKSIRNGKVNIAEAFITIKNEEAFIHNMNIQPYDKVSHQLPDPTRERKLLLHKTEIHRLMDSTGLLFAQRKYALHLIRRFLLNSQADLALESTNHTDTIFSFLIDKFKPNLLQR